MSITLVVQGRMHPRFLDRADEIGKHFSQVIVSTWRDQQYVAPPGWMTIEDDPANYYDWHNSDNVAYRTITTLNGLLLSRNKFTVVMRGDEYYTEWYPFLTEMGRNQTKLTTNNVNFVRDSWNKFQCSDHVIGGQTVNLIGTYTKIAHWLVALQKKQELNRIDLMDGRIYLDNRNQKVTPENLLTFGYLAQMGIIRPNDANSVEIMRDLFHCVSIEKMGEFCVKVGDNLFTTYEELFNYNRSIRDMSEIDL